MANLQRTYTHLSNAQIVLNGRSAQKRGGQHASPLQGPERVAMNHTMTPQTHIGCAAMQSSTAIRSLADVIAQAPPPPTVSIKSKGNKGISILEGFSTLIFDWFQTP